MLLRSTIPAVLLCGLWICAAQSPQAAPEKADNDAVLFGELPMVEAVSLHTQSLAEAPANVTVITAADIRRYGYRTLAEALNPVAGFYVTYDHEYHYVGVSGISLPGDFNTRFLVMLNGHPLTDNIYNSNGFFGQDFGLDMDLVERIEVVRGPTSALYGSNGILANINVVTRSPVDAERWRMSAETDSTGERKITLSSAQYLGKGANLLVAASAFNNTGVSSLPGDADGERGYHTFANLIWHDWSFTAYFNARNKQVPVGIGSSLSADPGQRAIDRRNFAAAAYKHAVGPGQIHWQFAFDQYRYRDRYDYPVNGAVESLRDCNRGDWLDSQLTYEVPVERVGLFTAGMAGSWNLRAEQYNSAGGLRGNDTDRRDQDAAWFAEQEWKLAARWIVSGGVRLDESRYFGRAVSPRLALVFEASPRTDYKLVYGRPYRNPSAFEQFYNDGGLSYAAAPPLRPEVADTFEASVEHRSGRSWDVTADAYHYRIRRVITAVDLGELVQQYRNTGKDLSSGVELAARGKLWGSLEASASTAFGTAKGGRAMARLANSPAVVSKVRLGLPVMGGALRDRLVLSAGLQYLSARYSWTGGRLGGFVLCDATAVWRVAAHYDLQGGLRNAFNRRYEDPIYLAVDRLPGDGRSAFVRLAWHARE